MISTHLGTEVNPALLLLLWLVVAAGSVLPVLPTGASVSAAAALAGFERPILAMLVVLIGAAGAYAGDLISYGVLNTAGSPLARRLGWLPAGDDASRLRGLRSAFDRRAVRTIVIARLLPGGRIPALLVAALAAYPWPRFAGAAGIAALLWSLSYALIGLGGSSLLPTTTTAVLFGVLGAVILTGLLRILGRRKARS